jgi:hypothetical protein
MNEGLFLNTIGRILSNKRLNSEITLQELSSKTGIDVEIIVGIEIGKISLGLEEFLKNHRSNRHRCSNNNERNKLIYH